MKPPRTNTDSNPVGTPDIEALDARLTALEETALSLQTKSDTPIDGLARMADRLRYLEAELLGSRVVLPNFEGSFKTLTSVPATNDGWRAGSLVFYDDGANRRLYAYMNGVWRVVTLT